MSTLDDAIQAIRMGDREEGRRLLEESLEADEGNEEIWLWLTAVVDTDEDREVCLENVLALNPNHRVAQKSLEDLRSGNFNARDIMQGAIVEEEEEESGSGATFLDEFRRSSEYDEDEDEQLVMPSTMAKSKSKGAAKKKGAGLKLNPRLIVLAVVVVLIICALASLATYNLIGGGVEPTDGQAGQETPAPGGGEVQPAATEPIPGEPSAEPPTPTPAPTNTPFQLPTPKPTDLPTPTATPVVAPTP
jgi:hypothetical protein